MRLRAALAVVVLAALALAPPVPAGAAYEPVGGGNTRLAFDPVFLSLLARNGVKLSAVAPARLSGGTLTLPLSGGKLDPTTSNGTLRHEGALVFTGSGGRIPLKALQLKTTARRTPFTAKVGGSQLKLGRSQPTVVSRRGFDVGIVVRSLELSPKLATRLGKKLKLRGVLKAGQPLGQSLTEVRPQTVTLLAQGSASLVMDPAFEAKLRSLFVAVNPIFPAEHPGAFTLPVGGGKLSPAGGEGIVRTEGALEFLQLGGGQLFWAESGLDLGAGSATAEVNAQPSPPHGGKVGRIPFAALGAGAFKGDPKSRALTLGGAFLTLDPAMAATFNQLFAEPQGKSDVFRSGEPVGSISFAARGQ
jgi:hypothetical protein